MIKPNTEFAYKMAIVDYELHMINLLGYFLSNISSW